MAVVIVMVLSPQCSRISEFSVKLPVTQIDVPMVAPLCLEHTFS